MKELGFKNGRQESQASTGFQAIPRKSSTVIPQAIGSPSVAYT